MMSALLICVCRIVPMMDDTSREAASQPPPSRALRTTNENRRRVWLSLSFPAPEKC